MDDEKNGKGVVNLTDGSCILVEYEDDRLIGKGRVVLDGSHDPIFQKIDGDEQMEILSSFLKERETNILS